MSKKLSYNIGCNIVDPKCDEDAYYTKDVYLENIARYREYGFTHIEFSHTSQLSVADAIEIKDFAQKAGVVLWSIHSEHLNGGSKKQLEEYFKKQENCCKIAQALGVKICVCHIPNIAPRGDDIKRDVALLTRLADITRTYGLKLAVETPPYDYIIKVVDKIKRHDVGINLDTGHCFLEGNDPAKVAKAIGKRLITTHLQDNFGENDDHCPPGLGKINWRRTLKEILATGYDGPLIVEITGEGGKMRRSVKELRKFDLGKELVFAKAYLEHLLKI
jgi:sugar phosphate isomerase/epimerase